MKKILKDRFLKTAIKAAFQAGKIIRKGFYQKKSVMFKQFADPVTEYDKASEKTIVYIIKKYFPEHSILTEENLSEIKDSEYKWIIDPLDGTVNFIHNIPFVAVSIALEYQNRIILGVVYNPIINELFYGLEKKGAFYKKKRIFVSTKKKISDALVATGFPYKRKGRTKELVKPLSVIFKDFLGFRRIGAASLDLAYLAAGKYEIYYEESLNPWDIAAGSLLVKEAGGTISNYNGLQYDLYNSKINNILATNGFLHKDAVKLLKDIKTTVT